tara:strand:+ start:54 stop:1352 length:1299 start_codon:yes stop_codon:yes gene_type:complete
MPNWKKVVTSGSNAVLNQITASGNISSSGAIIGDSINILSDSTSTGYKLYQPSPAGTLQLSTAAGGGFTKFYVKATTTEVLNLEVTGNTIMGTAPNGSQPTNDTISIHSVINNSITASANISASGAISGNSVSSTAAYYAKGDRVIYNLGDTVFLGDSAESQKIAILGSNILLNAPVTASGNISASGNILTSGNLSALGVIEGSNLNGTNTGDQSSSDILTLIENGVDSVHYVDDSIDTAHYAASSVDATALASNAVTTAKIADDAVTSAKLAHTIGIVTNITSPLSKIGKRDLDWAGAAAGDTVESVQGDVIYHAATTSTTPGAIYYMQDNGNVALADADAVGTSSTLLMVALGTNASQGLLLRGVAQLRIDPNATPGAPIYLSTTTGTTQSAAPTGTGDVVRILGYQLTNGVGNVNAVYFNPDNTWVLLT